MDIEKYRLSDAEIEQVVAAVPLETFTTSWEYGQQIMEEYRQNCNKTIAKAQNAKTASIKDAEFQKERDWFNQALDWREKEISRVMSQELKPISNAQTGQGVISNTDPTLARIWSEDGMSGVATGANKPDTRDFCCGKPESECTCEEYYDYT